MLAVLSMRGDLNRPTVTKVCACFILCLPYSHSPVLLYMCTSTFNVALTPCVSQIVAQTRLVEQEGGGASGGATVAEEKKCSAAALKKRLEERNLLSQLIVPNPYSMFGR